MSSQNSAAEFELAIEESSRCITESKRYRESFDEHVNSSEMCLNTIGLFGLQTVFATMFSSGTPFLLFLGFEKSTISLIWLSAPLSGMILQPYFGLLCDMSHRKYGHRKSFILGGGIMCVLALLCLAWTSEIISTLIRMLGANAQSTTILWNRYRKILSIISILTLNASTQAAQVGLRALVIDGCPLKEQPRANAWASRMVHLGNLIMYTIALSQPSSNTSECQIKALSAVSATTMTLTLILIWQNAKPGHEPAKTTQTSTNSVRQGMGELFQTAKKLSPDQLRVFKVQVLAWSYWFPFLFYTTTYIEGIASEMKGSIQTGGEKTSNITLASGYVALLLSAAVAAVGSLVIPSVIHRQGRGFSVTSIWRFSHYLVAVCMFSLPFLPTTGSLIFVISFIGVSWAISSWAPFTLLGISMACDMADEETGTTDRCMTASVLGLHNIAISLPQVTAAVWTSAVFWVSDYAGANGVRWEIGPVFWIAGSFAIIATQLKH